MILLNSAHLQGSVEQKHMENIAVNSSIDRLPTENHNQTLTKIEWKLFASFLGAFTPICVISGFCIYYKHKHGKVSLVILYVIFSFHPYLIANVNVKTIIYIFIQIKYIQISSFYLFMNSFGNFRTSHQQKKLQRKNNRRAATN